MFFFWKWRVLIFRGSRIGLHPYIYIYIYGRDGYCDALSNALRMRPWWCRIQNSELGSRNSGIRGFGIWDSEIRNWGVGIRGCGIGDSWIRDWGIRIRKSQASKFEKFKDNTVCFFNCIFLLFVAIRLIALFLATKRVAFCMKYVAMLLCSLYNVIAVNNILLLCLCLLISI